MSDFQNAVDRGRLKKLPDGSQSFVDELRRALEDLGHALSAWTRSDYCRVIENSHFAMKFFAEAILQARGYRSTNPYGLRIGLEKFWISTGDLSPEIIGWIEESHDNYQTPSSSLRPHPDANFRRQLDKRLIGP